MKRSLTLATATVLSGLAATSALAGDLTIVGWGGTTQAAHKGAYFTPYMEETGNKIIEDE